MFPRALSLVRSCLSSTHILFFTIDNTHSQSHHSFSDDNRLYITDLASKLSNLVSSTQLWISQLKSWMSVNKLKLNEDKTEMILTSPSKSILSLPSSVDLNGWSITIPSSVRKLGIMLDQSLSSRKHVANVCATWSFAEFPLFVTFSLMMPLKPFSVIVVISASRSEVWSDTYLHLCPPPPPPPLLLSLSLIVNA